MKHQYKWLLFDADGTLFDYDRAAASALKAAFECLGMHCDEAYVPAYHHIDQHLWQALERGEIAASVLPVRRFELLLESFRLDCSARDLSECFLEQLSHSCELIADASVVLRRLSAHFQLAIVTNGFQAVQRRRVAASQINAFITHLIISETVGVAKPKPAFFEATVAQLGYPQKSEVLLIGDSLTADIGGGMDYGLDTCWFNPDCKPRPYRLSITYEIRRLSELIDLLV